MTTINPHENVGFFIIFKNRRKPAVTIVNIN
jgi:hypothetical protein